MMARFPKTMIGWKMRILWGSFALDRWGTRIGKLISLTVIMILAVGGTHFFRFVFTKILNVEAFGAPLLWRVINVALTTLFGLLIVSNLITGIMTLYRSSEVPLLMMRPVSYRQLFLSRFIDNLGYSSWSLVVLGVPIIVAWGQLFDLSVWTIAAVILFGFAPIVLIAAELGVAALVGLIFLGRKVSPRVVVILVVAVIIVLVVWAVMPGHKGLNAAEVPTDSAMEHYLSDLSQGRIIFLIPSQWLFDSMREIQLHNTRNAFFLLTLITLTSIVWFRWLVIGLDKYYYHSWTTFSEMSSRSSSAASSISAGRFTRGILPNPLNAMLRKDMLQFIRNPSQWAQFLILIAFLLIYLLNLAYLSGRFVRYIFENPYWTTVILFLNFAFTGFILATLSVRFIFPLISLEGRSFWVVRSAPVKIELLFWEKFFLALMVFMGLCELIVFFSNHVLNLKGPMLALSTAGTFTMGAALTALAIGMGAMFPDFRSESPMRIASTPGGVLTVLISLLYVGLMVAILAWPTQGYFYYILGQGPLPFRRALQALGLLAGLNALVLLLPVSQGRQSLTNRDF